MSTGPRCCEKSGSAPSAGPQSGWTRASRRRSQAGSRAPCDVDRPVRAEDDRVGAGALRACRTRIARPRPVVHAVLSRSASALPGPVEHAGRFRRTPGAGPASNCPRQGMVAVARFGPDPPAAAPRDDDAARQHPAQAGAGPARLQRRDRGHGLTAEVGARACSGRQPAAPPSGSRRAAAGAACRNGRSSDRGRCCALQGRPLRSCPSFGRR